MGWIFCRFAAERTSLKSTLSSRAKQSYSLANDAAESMDSYNSGVTTGSKLPRDFVGGSVAAQQLRQVLGERRARQHHVTTNFVGLLLEVALNVREEADD